MSYLIVAVIFLLLGFAGASFLFRRHYRNYTSLFQEQESQLKLHEEQLEERKEALREIMYRTHHQGINPISKRIRGLTGLSIMANARLFNYLDLLSRPHHQDYSRLAMQENKEILEYLRLIERSALELETDTLDKVKEFEHLQ